MVFFPSLFSKAKKLSQASDKQKRINELLNASHNSQAERDYLRGQILKIFEEDEKALENMAKNVPPRQRKPGRSQSIDGVNSRIDEGFDEESDFLNKSQRRSNDNGSNTTSGLGSDDLQSRGSLQFIDVKVSGLEIALLIFATSYHQNYITLFEKSNFCPKIQFLQNPNIFTSFSSNFFFDNFSREIKIVNS